jgi:light-regulated signal transduction histidine kinase (bacteriophytochrome)
MTASNLRTPTGSSETTNLEDYGKAMLDILEDFSLEKGRLENAQRAVINILEDFAQEKFRLEDTQRAMLNLLDDFGMEREKTEAINRELREAFESLRLAKEAADAANRQLEAFAYSVSHDLRAPLRSIAGFSHFLMEDYYDKLDEEGRDSLNRISAATEKMARLIDDLLDLSRLTRAEMNRQRVNISTLVRKIADAKKKSQPERNVEFIIQDHLTVEGDGQLLGVALDNLLDNAWKFTGKSKSATIEFGAVNRDGQLVYFVRDSGVGFDMEYAGKLFQPFQRVHAMDEFAGTGIGLATVKKIVERHGGRVWIEAQKGKGTTVYFVL